MEVELATETRLVEGSGLALETASVEIRLTVEIGVEIETGLEIAPRSAIEIGLAKVTRPPTQVGL